MRLVVSLAVTGFNSCGDRQEEAKQELHARDFRFSVDEFMRAANAGDVPALKHFLDAGMRVDVEDAESNTALFRAVQGGHAAAVKLLISRGANVNVVGTGWDTPLIAAARIGSIETVQALLEATADPNKRTEKNWTALTAAAYSGHPETVKLLADKSRESLDEALQIAALQGKPAVIDALLNAGASVFSRSKESKTPLMYAALNGHLDAVKLLMMHGANRFALDGKDKTAADHAIAGGHDPVVVFLNDPQMPAMENLAAFTERDLEKDSEPPVNSYAVAQAGGSAAAGATAAREHGHRAPPLPAESAAEIPAGRPPSVGKSRSSALVISQSRAPLAALNGARLEGIATAESATVRAGLRMEDYRETQLPIMLEEVPHQGTSARIRVLYRGKNETESVLPGAVISDTGLELIKAERRFRDGKMGTGKLLDVSQAVVRDRATGQRHLVVRNVPARASEASAVVRVEGEESAYEARAGDEFTIGEARGVRFRVLDVRPTQIVVENVETGEPLTLPRAAKR